MKHDNAVLAKRDVAAWETFDVGDARLFNEWSRSWRRNGQRRGRTRAWHKLHRRLRARRG